MTAATRTTAPTSHRSHSSRSRRRRIGGGSRCSGGGESSHGRAWGVWASPTNHVPDVGVDGVRTESLRALAAAHPQSKQCGLVRRSVVSRFGRRDTSAHRIEIVAGTRQGWGACCRHSFEGVADVGFVKDSVVGCERLGFARSSTVFSRSHGSSTPVVMTSRGGEHGTSIGGCGTASRDPFTKEHAGVGPQA